jgi:predicted lipoprotein
MLFFSKKPSLRTLFLLNTMKKITCLLSALLLIAILFNCKKKKLTEDEDALETSFDKPAMLSNYADNVIVPNFINAKTSLDSFALAYTAFLQNKTVANLIVVRQKFNSAYIKFQHISLYEFGPSESELVRSNFNTYPTDSVQVKSNISNGSYNLGTLANLDAKGFPAIDYLLYGKNCTDADIVTLFDTDSHAANRITYLNDCLAEMQTKLNSIVNTWNTSYKSAFTASTGSEIGSSLGLLINQLDFEIDLLKNGKIGIPLGKKSLGVQLPEKCEAYYAHTISVSLAKECLLSIEDTYLGRASNGSDGIGIDDYLDAIKAQHNAGTLNQAIKDQFAVTKSKLALVPEPLSATITTNSAVVDAAYIEMVKLLVLLKTDTPSALGIVITYQDGDGD